MENKLTELELEILRDIYSGVLLGADYNDTQDNNGNPISPIVYRNLETRGYLELTGSTKVYAGIGDMEIKGITSKGAKAIR